jgi:DNA-binding CsgD family transcriptional regulator
VSPGGQVLAATDPKIAGEPVTAAFGADSGLGEIMAQKRPSGRLYVSWAEKRAAALYTGVGAGGRYLVSVYPDWTDFGGFRRAAVALVFAATAAAAALLAFRRREPLQGPAASADEPALPPGLPPLNDRERKLLLLLAQGRSNKEIAYEFGIKEQTVKNYLGPLYEKLGVHDRVSALLKLRGGAQPEVPRGST